MHTPACIHYRGLGVACLDTSGTLVLCIICHRKSQSSPTSRPITRTCTPNHTMGADKVLVHAPAPHSSSFHAQWAHIRVIGGATDQSPEVSCPVPPKEDHEQRQRGPSSHCNACACASKQKRAKKTHTHTHIRFCCYAPFRKNVTVTRAKSPSRTLREKSQNFPKTLKKKPQNCKSMSEMLKMLNNGQNQPEWAKAAETPNFGKTGHEQCTLSTTCYTADA